LDYFDGFNVISMLFIREREAGWFEKEMWLERSER
jgi:hypothetical protein